jgi:diguanylate cyclase (GGDEF)-like protein/PAS domain S-box-containing protein
MSRSLTDSAAPFRRLVRATRSGEFLPRGNALTAEAWSSRHRVIQLLLWIHVLGLPVVGAATGHGLAHPTVEAGVVGLFALGASSSLLGRAQRSALSTLGLLVSSALLVHFSGGMIEMHFHFFVMVAIATLYQSWLAFLLAVGFVALHHSIIGTLAPAEIFNHPAALASPWKWALIHAGFIGAQSLAGLAAWRVHELSVSRGRWITQALERANADLAGAQSLAHVGSWEWDLNSGAMWWSDELYRIMGVAPDGFQPVPGALFELVHPDDRARLRTSIETCIHGQGSLDCESRILRPDGEVRTIHALGSITVDATGSAARMFGSMQDATERTRLQDELKHQAFHDPLTGLANRILFADRVQHAQERLARTSATVAALFVDIDDFKDVNDGLGHSAGDKLLREVAARLKGVLRVEDTAARLGGDEFAVLIEEADEAGATWVADRCLAALREPILLEGKEIMVSGSIGIALGDSSCGVEELLRKADTAMYEAKKRGRDRYEWFEDHMQSSFLRRLELPVDLKRALESEEIVVYYQPIFRLDPLEMVGVEALVRWNHPDRGMILPGEFIPAAEDTGLIVPLGKRVLELACRQLHHWNETLERDELLRCGVNFSARQLGLPDFTEDVAASLMRHGVSPEQLVLEITESDLMRDPGAVAKQLADLADLGIVVAIDDFGTGYSSLSYLRRFPVRILKIDKFFVRGIGAGPEESAYAKAIVRLCHDLGLDVVAEGIETEQELRELVAMGCDFGQGFFLARPMPATALEAMAELEPGAILTSLADTRT